MDPAAASSSTRPLPARAEAGPLPRKYGELGFNTAEHVEADITDTVEIPAEAPASPRPSPTTPPTQTAASAAAASTTSLPIKKARWWHSNYKGNSKPLIWGLHGPTMLRAAIILCLIGGLAATWAISTTRLAAISKAAEGKEVQSSSEQMASYMAIFLHAAFGVTILVLIIAFERTLFFLRAQRWIHTHPGGLLPLRHGGNAASRSVSSLSAAPWNRPSLPTYAAALGYRGTGDAEDDMIAPAPPPAYGNTRGSVLLLTSLLRRVSGASTTGSPGRRASGRMSSNLRSPISPRTPRDFQQIPESRPVSYISVNTGNDIQRAHELELSLARLESGTASTAAVAQESARAAR